MRIVQEMYEKVLKFFERPRKPKYISYKEIKRFATTETPIFFPNQLVVSMIFLSKSQQVLMVIDKLI